jgi:hypothetical protein
MANIYKNAFFNLTTTDVKQMFILSPSNSRAIIKTIHTNNHVGAANTEIRGICYMIIQ